MAVKVKPLEAPQAQTLPARWRRYGVGIDAHSRFAYVCVQVPEYALAELRVHEGTFQCTRDGLRDARAWVERVLRTEGVADDNPTYAIESTATYHCLVMTHFGGRPIVLNPHLARASLKKTDRFDAGTLAYHCLTGLYRESWLPRAEYVVLRTLLRSRLRLASYRRRLISSATLRMVEWGVTLPFLNVNVDHPSVRGWIEDMAAGCVAIEQMPRALQACFEGTAVPREVLELVTQYLALADDHAALVELLDDKIQAHVRTYRWPMGSGEVQGMRALEVLKTIPGVGDLTALTVLAEIGDWRRFERDDQAAAYAGFDPMRRISAGKVVGVALRSGNRWLRRMLVQAAQGTLNRRREPLGIWAYRIKQRRKHNVAVVALARRLARLCWQLLRTGQEYDASKLGATAGRVHVADVLPRRVARALTAEGLTWLDDVKAKLRTGALKVPGLGPASMELVRRACGFTEPSDGAGGASSDGRGRKT